jgi:antitoxin Phd
MEWPLHDAKNRFSAVIEAASQGEAQTVTKRGVATAVVLSVEEYRRLRELEAAAAPSFGEHLLAIPRAHAEDEGADFERLDVELRDPEL